MHYKYMRILLLIAECSVLLIARRNSFVKPLFVCRSVAEFVYLPYPPSHTHTFNRILVNTATAPAMSRESDLSVYYVRLIKYILICYTLYILLL